MIAHVNTAALYEALDAKREQLDMSWRQIASRTGVSPSVFSRLTQGQAPGSHILAALLVWLGHTPFWITED